MCCVGGIGMDENWEVVCSLLPDGWRDLARDTGVLKGVRKDKSPEKQLRVLLLHLARGYSLRETVMHARLSGLADLSDVALLKRLKKSGDWLREMCVALFREQVPESLAAGRFRVRAFDATVISEPGRSGRLWRLHYSVCLPSLACDYFKLTPGSGKGTGETFRQFPVREGDLVLADRAYSTGDGVQHAVSGGGDVLVRVNTGMLQLRVPGGGEFDLAGQVRTLKQSGRVGSWPAEAVRSGGSGVLGRICVVRKSQAAAEAAQKKLRSEAARKQRVVQKDTLTFAKYVIVFTTVPETVLSTEEVLEWYRARWQVELVFKRFKTLAQLGHIPKYDENSVTAWLYGKLLIALLSEKLTRQAAVFSPWGYNLQLAGACAQHLA